MPTHNRPNFLNDEGILLQLLLSSYVTVCKEIKPALKLIKTDPKSRDRKGKILGNFVEEIGPAMGRVAGSYFKSFFAVPWKDESGLLEKMEEYALTLLLHKSRNRPSYFALYTDIGEARAQAKHCLKLLKLWQVESSSYMQRLDDRNVLDAIEDLMLLIKKIGNSLSDALQFSSENENVVVYFLRKQEEIATYVGKGFVKNVLAALPPKAELIKKFEVRGFGQVCEEIEALL
jgi:hypothetical protein